MRLTSRSWRCAGFGAVLLLGCLASVAAQSFVVTETNVPLRVMAANITSGSSQAYEAPGIRIFQGLKPDIVANQEFNYGDNSAASLRSFVNTAFGTNFAYFRESGYSIPNGIISRFPILASGSWVDVDTGVNDRGFAWGRIDIPGTNDLYVVSVHLKASSTASDASRRYAQATNLVNLIRANFPSNAWIIVAGDCNIYDPSEAAYQHLATNFSDTPTPVDAAIVGDPDTNQGRSERYDYVFTSRSLSNRLTATVYGTNSYPKGLVFDTRIYESLADFAPAQQGDSGVTGMQHMAVVRTYNILSLITNSIAVAPPTLTSPLPGVVEWQGISNLTYTVQGTVDPVSGQWQTLGTASSSSSRFSFTNAPQAPQQYYRVVYP